jgi:hypothetical protein
MVLPDSFCSCFLQPWRDSFSLGASLAHWATVLGVVGALIATYYALQTYRSNNSIRKWELIQNNSKWGKRPWEPRWRKTAKRDVNAIRCAELFQSPAVIR